MSTLYSLWLLITKLFGEKNREAGCRVRLGSRIQQRNEWYPRGLQISLHIRSPGLQDYSEVWNLKFFWFGGGYSGTVGFGLSDNFHFGGGYSRTGRFGLSDNFHFGGVFWDSWIWTLWQFSFWGGILGQSDLDSLTIIIGGGGYSVPSYYRIGVFCGIWTKISTTPAGSSITDSL